MMAFYFNIYTKLKDIRVISVFLI